MSIIDSNHHWGFAAFVGKSCRKSSVRLEEWRRHFDPRMNGGNFWCPKVPNRSKGAVVSLQRDATWWYPLKSLMFECLKTTYYWAHEPTTTSSVQQGPSFPGGFAGHNGPGTEAARCTQWGNSHDGSGRFLPPFGRWAVARPQISWWDLIRDISHSLLCRHLRVHGFNILLWLCCELNWRNWTFIQQLFANRMLFSLRLPRPPQCPGAASTAEAPGSAALGWASTGASLSEVWRGMAYHIYVMYIYICICHMGKISQIWIFWPCAYAGFWKWSWSWASWAQLEGKGWAGKICKTGWLDAGTMLLWELGRWLAIRSVDGCGLIGGVACFSSHGFTPFDGHNFSIGMEILISDLRAQRRLQGSQGSQGCQGSQGSQGSQRPQPHGTEAVLSWPRWECAGHGSSCDGLFTRLSWMFVAAPSSQRQHLSEVPVV